MSNPEFVARLRQAADIQKEAGDLYLAMLLNDAALEIRRLEGQIEEARAILAGEW